MRRLSVVLRVGGAVAALDAAGYLAGVWGISDAVRWVVVLLLVLMAAAFVLNALYAAFGLPEAE